MSSLYLDASAITKLVVEEPETGSLHDFVRGRHLASSRVAVVEVVKAVGRANPEADAHPIFALLAFVELDADLAVVAAATGGTGLRALDAIHIASAMRLGDEVDTFVTYDVRQASAARAIGLHVDAPGSPLALL